MVSKKEAYEAFVYHGERIFTPLGNKDSIHEKLRAAWAYIHDSGLYRKVTAQDPTEQDTQVLELFEKAGKVF